MKRMIWISMLGLLAISSTAVWVIPSQITYQGTLKDRGLPANGNYAITFQLTDQSGSTPYSAAIIKPTVPVTNGLFSVLLDFQLLGTNTWDTITPYLKVTVNGQDLHNPEPVSATAYANVSNSVVNGAISPAKVASGYGLIPAGGIVMFQGSCPTGWTVFTGLQGKVPMGADPNNTAQFTAGQGGGNLTHSHTGHTQGADRGPAIIVGTPDGAVNGQYLEDIANQHIERASVHSHAIPSDSSLPPYLTVVFCQKQ